MSGESGAPLYRLSRALVRLGVRVFYRRVVVHTLEHVPPRGPVIFAATHPNSIIDPLVLGSAVSRRVSYLAHSGLFRKPLLGWLLPRCGVIPVYRPEDFPGPVDNSRMFTRCIEVLEQGEAIGIFPEGTSHQEEPVKRLRTGTARIALFAEDRADFRLGVQIVPVGLNFQAPGRFRSDVLVRIGPPLTLHPLRRLWSTDPTRAVQELTDELQRRLETLVPELPGAGLAPLVRRTARLLQTHGSRGTGGLVEEHFAARDVGAVLAWAARERSETYRRFVAELDAHARELRGRGVSEAALVRGELPWQPRGPAAVALGLAGLPVALGGALLNALPYRLTDWATRRWRPDPTKVAVVKFSAGLLVYLGWYAMLGALAWRVAGPRAAIIVLTAAPAAGWLALRYLPSWRTGWQRARAALADARSAGVLERLRADRRALEALARQLWDEFHAARPAW